MKEESFPWLVFIFLKIWFHSSWSLLIFFSIWKQSNKMNAWNKFIKHIPPYFCFVTHLQSSLLFLEFPWKNDRFSDLPLASLAAMLIILHLPFPLLFIFPSLCQDFLSSYYLMPCTRIKRGEVSRFPRSRLSSILQEKNTKRTRCHFELQPTNLKLVFWIGKASFGFANVCPVDAVAFNIRVELLWLCRPCMYESPRRAARLKVGSTLAIH